MNLCVNCGTTPGYPHKEDCLRPKFSGVPDVVCCVCDSLTNIDIGHMLVKGTETVWMGPTCFDTVGHIRLADGWHEEK
jgi:hypothetical protein